MFNSKQKALNTKIEQVKDAGKKIELQRIQESKKTIEEQKLREQEYKQNIENQINELRKQVEAKKASKLAQAAQAVASKAIPTAYAGSCADWIVQAGVSDIANASELIRRESGCNPNAVNRSSGACGIPQALPCSKLGTSDPVAQIRWMQNYVLGRYSSWENAVQFHNLHGWY